MKKVLAFILVAVLVLVGWLVRRALTPDETRIRWLVEGMADGFNGSRAGPVVDALADEFREPKEKLKKEEVHAMLAWLFLNQRDPVTKDFRFRVTLKDVTVHLVEPERATATVQVQAVMAELRSGQFVDVWELEVEGDLAKRDGGWKVLSSRYTGVSGKRPF